MTEAVKEAMELMKNSVYVCSLEDPSELKTVESIMRNTMDNLGIEEFQIDSMESPYGNFLGSPAFMVALKVERGPYSRSSIIKGMMNGLREELSKKGSALKQIYNKCLYFNRE